MKSYLVILILYSLVLAGQSGTTVIGNSGQPTTTVGHIPFHIPAMALDAAGNLYTVHDWDEPHYNIIKWDPITGKSVAHSGNIVPGLLDGIAVEQDGSYAYCSGYIGYPADPSRTNLTFAVWKINLNTYTLTNFTSTGPSIVIYNGTVSYPAGSTLADQHDMEVPIHSLAITGNSLWVTDSIGNRLIQYDKNTGNQISSINVPLANGVAIDSGGNLWVGSAHSVVQTYSPSGALLATSITGLSDVWSLSISGSTLFVGDQGAAHVTGYQLSGANATLITSFGSPAQSGQVAHNLLGYLNDVRVNQAGDLYVSDSPGSQGVGGYLSQGGGGARLQKIKISTLAKEWAQRCTAFVANISYPSAHPARLISGDRNIYHADRTNFSSARSRDARTDYNNYFGNYGEATGGITRAITLGGNDFLYFPCYPGNLAIYRYNSTDVNTAPALCFCGALAQSAPGPDGVMYPQVNKYLWSWNDTGGPGLKIVNASTNLVSDPATVIDQNPSDGPWLFAINSMNVDSVGTIWIAAPAYVSSTPPPYHVLGFQSIWAVPLKGLNAAGNPIYHWADAVEVVTNGQLCAAMGVTPGQDHIDIENVDHSSDGMLYIQTYNYTGTSRGYFHQGANTLIGYSGVTGPTPVTGAPTFVNALSNYSVGISAINGGVLIGENTSTPYGNGEIYRYDSSGVFITKYTPDQTIFGNSFGSYDYFGALNAEQAPDGTLDIFAEDDYNGRIFWYNLPN